MAGHTDSVMSVSFSPDSRQVVSGSTDQNGTSVGYGVVSSGGSADGGIRVGLSVSFSPDGRQVVSGSRDGRFVCGMRSRVKGGCADDGAYGWSQ